MTARRPLVVLNGTTQEVAATDTLTTQGGTGATEVPTGGQLPSALRRTGALAETFSRAGTTLVNQAALSSGLLHMVAIPLPKGALVSSVTFMSATTALVTGTHAWAALYDSSLALLGQSTDDTAPVWAASAEHTFTLATPFTTTYAGLHYIGLMVFATTVPSLAGVSTLTAPFALAPVIEGASTASLTTTAPNPAAALTAVPRNIWAYVS